jgi:hypothetical protein
MRRSHWRALARILACAALYALVIGLASALWRRPAALAASYALLSALLLWRWHAPADVLYFVIPGILGSLGEYVAVAHGAWHYSLAWINIPVWLPLAWGASGLCMKRIADAALSLRAAPRE